MDLGVGRGSSLLPGLYRGKQAVRRVPMQTDRQWPAAGGGVGCQGTRDDLLWPYLPHFFTSPPACEPELPACVRACSIKSQ